MGGALNIKHSDPGRSLRSTEALRFERDKRHTYVFLFYFLWWCYMEGTLNGLFVRKNCELVWYFRRLKVAETLLRLRYFARMIGANECRSICRGRPTRPSAILNSIYLLSVNCFYFVFSIGKNDRCRSAYNKLLLYTAKIFALILHNNIYFEEIIVL